MSRAAAMLLTLVASGLLLFSIWGCDRAAITPAEAASAPASSFRPPINAEKWQRTFLREIAFYWGSPAPAPQLFGQVHAESAWREGIEGPPGECSVGLSQFTCGTATWAQAAYGPELGQLCAEKGGCPADPHWALRALTIWDRDLYLKFRTAKTEADRFAFAFSAYNSGAWADRERQEAGRRGLDKDRWWESSETVCLRLPKNCEITRRYVRKIWLDYRPLYAAWLISL